MRESHNVIAAQVGARLKGVRGALTQEEFARRLGLSQAQYNRYETGKRLAPDGVLAAAARIAGLSPEELAFGPGAAPPAEAAAGEYARAVAELVELLDPQSQEDLLVFLKAKARDASRRRQAGFRRAFQALEKLSRQTG